MLIGGIYTLAGHGMSETGKGSTISHVVVYRNGSATGQPKGPLEETFCGPAIGVEQYLGCFSIHGSHVNAVYKGVPH